MKPGAGRGRAARWRWLAVLAVAALAAGVYVLRPAAGDADAPGGGGPAAAAPLPRLVDLGADRCVPCKLMAPILEELRAEYAGRLRVEFVDVWKDPAAGREHGVRLIPTQIFFAADGTELHRHEGFYAKSDILAKWRELGVEL